MNTENLERLFLNTFFKPFNNEYYKVLKELWNKNSCNSVVIKYITFQKATSKKCIQHLNIIPSNDFINNMDIGREKKMAIEIQDFQYASILRGIEIKRTDEFEAILMYRVKNKLSNYIIEFYTNFHYFKNKINGIFLE
ncbi:MAG: hypothetical protein HQ541_18320 [Mariniphaga sp.]|nr:hypothetical protein [Mariniphaga sp.]